MKSLNPYYTGILYTSDQDVSESEGSEVLILIILEYYIRGLKEVTVWADGYWVLILIILEYYIRVIF